MTQIMGVCPSGKKACPVVPAIVMVVTTTVQGIEESSP